MYITLPEIIIFMVEITSFLVWTTATVAAWGYPGIFLINMISSASIIFPLPGALAGFAFVTTLNPWLIGLSAGLGSAVGELVAYGIGAGGRRVIRQKYEKQLAAAEALFRKHGPFAIIVLFAATPLPTDVVGILSGIIRYDIRKFFLAVVIGKVIINTVLVLSVFYGVGFILGLG